MRIAVMTDVHANLPALQVALRGIGEQGCDIIYHSGDAIGIGPYPAECVDLLLNTRGMRCLMGNHDAWFAFGLPDPWPYDPEGLVHQHWVHGLLDPALRAVVATWPAVMEEAPDNIGVTLLHYALKDAPGRFAPIVVDPGPADLDLLFTPYASSRLLFYGHHHPFSDLTGRVRYINPGSLGCHTAPLARYTLLETLPNGRYTLEHRAAPYDATPLLAEMDRRRVPGRDFIRRVFLRQDEGTA
jgi:predicted phosphodiesterase